MTFPSFISWYCSP